MATHLSYCRLCPATCGVRVTVEDNEIVSILGDGAHPLSGGYTCPKGRHGADFVHGPDRLRTSLRRNRQGTYEPIDIDDAVAEIAARLGEIDRESGADALGLFMGTQQNFATLTGPMARAWFRTTGSHKLFSTMTIDQSAKWIVEERMGRYLGGRQRFDTADVWLLAGTNPMVSLNGGDGDGAITQNPYVTLRNARTRGLRLIVVDPRRTETARRAHLHLMNHPGTDAMLFAGLLHVILAEDRHDREFCASFATQLYELRLAVAPATPERVADVTGVPETQLVLAARMFADGPRGMATSGTGICMGPDSNVAEHLVAALNVVCGRYLRAGEQTDNRNVLVRSTPPRAEVMAPQRSWERGFHSRIDGVGTMHGELPSGILADEILEPGTDRLRALIVSGGNPARALPDRARTERALRALDLLVCVDTHMSDTARLADYVIAPAALYERADHTMLMEPFFARPFAQYTPPLVNPPTGVVEDWDFFLRLATASGNQVKFAGRMMDRTSRPTADDLLRMMAERGRVDWSDLHDAPRGVMAPGTIIVESSTTESPARLELCPADVADELRDLLGVRQAPSAPVRTMRLLVRRMRTVMNSLGRSVPGLPPLGYNPAQIHPDTASAVGVGDGDIVRVTSSSGQIRAVVQIDPTVPVDAISMTHGWGDSDAESDPYVTGSNVNDLIDARRRQRINAMPTMTAVAVTIEKEVSMTGDVGVGERGVQLEGAR